MRYYSDIDIRSREPLPKTVKLEEIGHFLLNTTANGIIDLHLFDSVGYGDYRDMYKAITDIQTYLADKHEKWRNIDAQSMLEEELRANDERIHCIFYFISAHR